MNKVRKCIRCKCDMLEGYEIETGKETGGVYLKDSKIWNIYGSIDEIKVAVCPSCGELSFYIDDIDKLEKIRNKGIEDEKVRNNYLDTKKTRIKSEREISDTKENGDNT